jgi:hypothetical protein
MLTASRVYAQCIGELRRRGGIAANRVCCIFAHTYMALIDRRRSELEQEALRSLVR